MRYALSIFLAGCGVLLSVAHAGAAELPDAFTKALQSAGIPLSNVAVMVQPLDASEPVLSHNADAALNPASVMKLVTSFAALNQLGPAYTWTTSIWADGPISNGTLVGDLIIKGSGDPGLTLERLWLMQRALRARGVQHIQGNLVLDTGYFDVPETDPGAFDGEPLAPYNAVPGALLANFNAMGLHLKADGNRVQITPEVALPGVVLESTMALDDTARCIGLKETATPIVSKEAGLAVVIGGRYVRHCGEQRLTLNLFDPATTFGLMFRGLWAESGGSVSGATFLGPAPSTEPLLTFSSAPLTDTLTRLNKFSNNVMTRNLFLTLGAEKYGAPATLDKSAQAVRELLMQRGVSARKLVLQNGAGLSRIERISAVALTQMLRSAYRSPLFSEFESTLPIVSVDGTLKRRFNGSGLAGRAHLKTGTLRDVSALAGYVYTANGERVSFVMLVNHANARQSEAAQRTLLEWVYAGYGREVASRSESGPDR